MKLKHYILSGMVLGVSACGSDPSNVGLDDDIAFVMTTILKVMVIPE